MSDLPPPPLSSELGAPDGRMLRLFRILLPVAVLAVAGAGLPFDLTDMVASLEARMVDGAGRPAAVWSATGMSPKRWSLSETVIMATQTRPVDRSNSGVETTSAGRRLESPPSPMATATTSNGR